MVVWTTHLGLGILPTLLSTFLRHGRFQLRYTAASKDGRLLAGLLRATGMLTAAAKPEEFSLHGLRVDDPESSRLLIQGSLPNQFTDLFMEANKPMLEKFTYPDPRVSRDRVIINLRKAAAQTTVDVLAFMELARYRHKMDGESYRRLVIVTPHAAIAHLIPREWVGDDVKFVAPLKRDYSLVLRLGRSVIRFLGDAIRPKKPKMDHPPSIAAAAAWGVNPAERLNDLFWWWDSKIPVERTIFFFDRTATDATRDAIVTAEQFGIKCVVLEKDAAGDSKRLLWRATPGFWTAARRLWGSTRIFFWGAFHGKSRRWVVRQTMDMLHTSERMEDFLSDFNVRAMFHHQDGGLDYQSLACDAVGAARVGHHWSYFPWPETAVARLHQVYFVWGDYQAKMLEATGSDVDHVLLAGCTVHGAYPGSDTGDFASAGRTEVEANGATRVIALFDTSLPCASFYEFFLRKVIEDPRLGLLIKPKKADLPWLRYNLPELTDLYETAMATGRVKYLEPVISPTEAAAVADISIAVDINSAAVCAALAGHRAVHLDYVRVHASPLADWATLHKAGPNSLVFDNPDELWEGINLFFDQRENDDPVAENNLGVAANAVLEHIDPFRDGRAGQRIGQYLGWYLEALDEGLARNQALNQADSNYAAAWGGWALVPRESAASSASRKLGSLGLNFDPESGSSHSDEHGTVSGAPR